MATCGYICPSCNGSERTEDGSACTWCMPVKPQERKDNKATISDEEWMNAVHFGSCCSDFSSEEAEEKNDNSKDKSL
ncbi:MAG TPA: hypothetical protein VK796_07170 [Cytophaga sp.]|jgi:hypothetical protein|nr:hypothetical protein [Cytophaga sp.]